MQYSLTFYRKVYILENYKSDGGSESTASSLLFFFFFFFLLSTIALEDQQKHKNFHTLRLQRYDWESRQKYRSAEVQQFWVEFDAV